MLLLRYIITTIACCLFLNSFGQSVLTGKVTDKRGTIPGVNVFITNENNRVFLGVITDMKGEYYLRMPVGENLKLNFSFIGYKTHIVDYTGQKVENVILREDDVALDEVLVLGKGRERSDLGIISADLGSATQRVTFEDMDEMGAVSVEDMLQGKLSNVDLISSDGDPGSVMSIRIRGTSSLSVSAEPLIVVDGIAQDIDIDDDFDFSDEDPENFGALVSISPSDIASVEVLKDAAATAIWGERGGNGVLVITTKRGSVGMTRFNVSQKVNISFEPAALDLLDGFQYVTMVQESMWNHAVDDHIGRNIGIMTENGLVFNPNAPNAQEYNQDTKWLEEITRSSISSSTNFSMSGGGDRATYRFSLGYSSDVGTAVGTSYNRLNARLNIDYKFSDKLRFSTGISYSDGTKNAPYKTARAHAINKMPNMSPYILTEDGERTDIYFTPEDTPQGGWQSVFNPIAMSNESFKKGMNRNTSLNMKLGYRISDGLRFSSSLGANVVTGTTESYLPQVVTGVDRLDNTNYNRSFSSSKEGLSISLNNNLSFEKNLNEANKINLGVGLQINDRYNSNSKLTSYGGPSLDLSLPTNGISQTASSGSGGNSNNKALGGGNSGSRSVALRFAFHYNLLNRYMFTSNYRISKSSRSSKTKGLDKYPSTAFIWRASNESFLKDEEWLSNASVRMSYGKSGKGPSGNHDSVGKFSALDNYGDLSAVGPSSMELSNLRDQVTTQANIGIDVDLWSNKVSLAFDCYYKYTEDLLQKNVVISSVTGYEELAYYNDGEMSNRGWDLRVNINRIIHSGDFSMSGSFTISRNTNIIEKVPNNLIDMIYPESLQNKTYANSITAGHPLGSFYGFNYLGVYSDTEATYVRNDAGQLVTDMAGNPVVMQHEDQKVSPGDAIYKDVNGDGVINRSDLIYLGKGMPDMIGGFGLRFRYKALSLSSSFSMRIGYDIINQARMNLESMGGYNNQSTAVLRRWRREGDVTDIPRAIFGDKEHYNLLGSDRFVEDVSFLRLNSLSLKYSIPKNLIERWGISNASLSISAGNLFTWTNYTGQDPEVSIKAGIKGGMGTDKALTPKSRKVSAGVSFNF